MTSIRRSILWDCLAGAAAGLLLALIVVLVTSCGSSARIDASALTSAEISILDPGGAMEPRTLVLDLSDQAVRDRLLQAYASMAPWTGKTAGLREPDILLTLSLAGDRRSVLGQSMDDYTVVRIEQYVGDRLEDTIYMQPRVMYEFMTDLATQTWE